MVAKFSGLGGGEEEGYGYCLFWHNTGIMVTRCARKPVLKLILQHSWFLAITIHADGSGN